ncbi:hypothetical protein SESBI_33657 [Sesbania bispinosa]|nr:hypothetical protein SESBI_33657 [Sesbania bispinosa]
MWVKGKGRPPPCIAKEDVAAATGGSMWTAARREWTAAAWSNEEGHTAAARGRRASGGSRPFRTAEDVWVSFYNKGNGDLLRRRRGKASQENHGC